MGTLSEASGAVVIHSKGLIEERQDRGWGEVSSISGGLLGGGGVCVGSAGFPSDLDRVSHFPS